MKRKSILTFCAIALMLVLSLSLFTACKKNKHDFAAEWKYDETYHWHECTTKKHSDTSEKIAHDFDGGEITTQPTEQAKGVKTFTCNTCGYQKVEEVAQLTHVHTFNESKWESDENNHWHAATCAHTDEKKDFAPHTWNDGVITKPSDYGVEGEKTFTCTTCSATRAESVPATPPKYNTLTFDGGLELGKTYDGMPVVLNPANVRFNGNGALTIEYKLEDESDSTYTTTAPTDAGEYIVRASVAGTAEWYGISNTKSFTIKHRILTLSESVYSKKIDQNLESGKFGLECKNVQEETNNVVTWVTVEVPNQYRTVGIHNMRVGELIVDNPNYMFNVADETNEVRLTVWDAPEFYAGVEDRFSITGRGTVLSVQIANGTVNTGDQLHLNELGKVITVTAMQKGSQAVETATAGDTVGLLTKDVTRDEVKRGYTLTKLDTVASYDKFTATIRVSENKKTPIFTGYAPTARFVFIEGVGEIPSTITLPISSGIMPGYTLAGVTVDFKGATVPAFVGRRFLLIEGGKTVAEGVVTDVASKTRVNCTVSAPTGKTAVIEPIQGGEKTFALNLSRSSAIEDLVDSEAIDLVVKYNGVIVGSYKRTGLGVGEGDLAHVENGGTLQGSYVNVNLAKGVAGLTDADGNWICEQANVTFDVSATLTQQLDNLGEGSVTKISLGTDEVKYFTLDELENLPSGWYSFVNALYISGSIYNINHYSVYTDAGEKVDMMSDMFKSDGGKYYVRYTTRKPLTDESVGFKAAKAELTATNTTSSFAIPSGKKGDRLVIKVTLNKAVSYFHTNRAIFQEKVAAFNANVVKVFYDNYQAYTGIGYQSLSAGDWFYLPSRNSAQTYAYIVMEYYQDLESTAVLRFLHSTAGIPILTSELQTFTIGNNARKNFIFKAPTTGQYKIEIAETDSSVLIPPTTISVDQVYDPDCATVNIIGNTNFNANATGYYSLTLKNMTNSVMNVRIRVYKVS